MTFNERPQPSTDDSGNESVYAGILLAGETPGSPDPLALEMGYPKKSLIPIASRPMAAYVLDAFASVKRIGPIVIIGLRQEDQLDFPPHTLLHDGFGDLLDNILGAVEMIKARYPHIRRTIIASADIPLLTADVIDRFIDSCQDSDHEVYYALVEKEVMEKQYPGSGRSYRRFGDRAYAGGDLYMVATHLGPANLEKVREAMAFRKSGPRMARVLGLKAMIKFALGQLTLEETIPLASRVLGLNGTVIVSPDASLAMDVDKPFQLQMVEALIMKRDLTA